MPSPLLLAITPLTRTMDDLDLATLWQNRRHWVFKPITSHGGKGVLLIPEQTLAQHLAPPPSFAARIGNNR